MKNKLVLKTLILGAAVGLAVQAHALRYEVDIMEFEPGASSYGEDMNEAGQVVGSAYTADSPFHLHAYIWDKDSGITDLGTLGGYEYEAFAINDAGQVAGWDATYNKRKAFYWDKDIGMIEIDGTYSNDINEAGQVTGWVGSIQPFYWDMDSGMIEIGTSGIGYDINDAGQAVGYNGRRHAFIWDKDNGMLDLGTLGGYFSEAYAINEAGQVVGWAKSSLPYPAPSTPAFIWDKDSGMISLGTLDGAMISEAHAINDAGQVAGWSYTADGGQHAFYWDKDSGMLDVGTLGGTYSLANDINEAGQVVGCAATAGGQSLHAYIWDKDSGMIDLNSLIDDGLGLELTRAIRINEAGQILVTYARNNDGVWKTVILTPDSDDDGIIDVEDNCPYVPNTDQADWDDDSAGDVCDDSDYDGVFDAYDNCRLVYNPDGQENNWDEDEFGDACDLDIDNDGVLTASDMCEYTPVNPQKDFFYPVLGRIVVDSDGCTIDQLCPCDGVMVWEGNSDYHRCVVGVSGDFLVDGLIYVTLLEDGSEKNEKDDVIEHSGTSDCAPNE